jgi:hypothetical protein
VELLKYRNDSVNAFEAGGMLATDTLQVYGGIDSYAMLHAVILDRRAEERVLPYAIERALLLVGPGKVFGDVRRDAEREPALFAEGARRALLERTREAHVWVGGSAFIDERDMPRAEARKILERMAAEVRAGASFDAVYLRTQEEQSYGEGAARRTRVGNYGEWVLSAGKRTAEPFVLWVSVPKGHVERLFEARAGETVMLEEDEGEARRVVLYYVREVYRPG